MSLGPRWAALGLALVVQVSCGPVSQAPRAVRPETDVCPECRMTVLSSGSAAQVVDGDGQVLVFDDVGCLLLYVKDRPNGFSGAKFYVQDHGSLEWIDVETATFVRADGVATPMNYGWHAFGSVDAGRKFAEGQPGSRLVAPPAFESVVADLEPRRWKP